jgi:predicted site-specific integrase-resolvase
MPKILVLVIKQHGECGNRVSSAENKKNLDAQAERSTNYAMAKGYRIYKVVKEVGSGLNDNRKQLAKILVTEKIIEQLTNETS